VTVVNNALNVERLEHLDLVGVRSHVQPRQGQRRAIGLPVAARLREGIVRPVTITVVIGVVVLVCRVVPVCFEVAENFAISGAVAMAERRTFHSTPSNMAERDKFDEPTYAVSSR
jgi:hypothetical protein